MGVLERMQLGAEAGWEGVKETVKSGGNIIAGAKAVENYLKGTEMSIQSKENTMNEEEQ